MNNRDVVIIGAGPAGIGAALSLKKEGMLLEQGAEIGGLCRSIVIDGAVFDFGGHSFHTPHPEVRDLVYNSLEMTEQKREARCFSYDSMISYPFQKHYKQLKNQTVLQECAVGLEQLGDAGNVKNFEEFIIKRFGKGISEHFMLPYNRKLWGRDLKKIAADWTNERVAAPEGVKEKFDTKGGKRKPLQSDTGVAYPAKGGFGEIFTAIGKQIQDVRFNQSVNRIDMKNKTVYTSSGESYKYRHLVSTLPLDQLLTIIDKTPSELLEKIKQLDCLSLKLGLVVIGHPVDTSIQRIYSAEEHIPAHKTAINHNSSDYLRKLPHHGIMAEISTGPDKELKRKDMETWIVDSLETMGVIKDRGEVKSVQVRDVKYAYPVPTLNRDAIISEIKQWLEENGIFTVGRFGEWAYINADEAIYRGLLLGRKIAGL